MKKSVTALFLFFLASFLLACNAISPAASAPQVTTVETLPESPVVLDSNILDGAVEVYDPNVDYFPDKVNLRYAETFSVEYHPNYKVVTLLNPWRDAGVTYKYILVQRGTPVPDDVGDATVVEVPVNTVASLSTTHLPYLDQLGLVDRLIGVSKFDYINTPRVIQKIEAGNLTEVGGDADVNVELLFDLNPELITTLGLGRASKDNHPKLIEAGFDVVLVSDFMETTPLGRAEWIKFMALFFNREAAAEEHFADVAARYEEMAALVHEVEERPTVLMGFENRGTWYLPGGQNYMARYVADAGADYLWADDDSGGRIPLDFEAVYEHGGNADYWLNLSQFWISLDDVLAGDERYTNFAPFTTGSIYNNNARLNEGGGNDFNESGHANPDVILADLIKIFHPDLLPDHELIYYRHLE